MIQILSSESLTQAWSNISATLQMQKAVQTEMRPSKRRKETSPIRRRRPSRNANADLATAIAYHATAIALDDRTIKGQLLHETKSQESTYKSFSPRHRRNSQLLGIRPECRRLQLLGDQTNATAWGCYYNQRDAPGEKSTQRHKI